jgi:uncharacterized protein (DUF1778 family)
VTLATHATERNFAPAHSLVANDVSNQVNSADTLLAQLRKSPSNFTSSENEATQEKLKRIELRATQEFMDVLDELAKKENLSRADVIRKGVALYARALIEASKGRLIGVISLKDGQIHTEEVFHV